MESISKKKAKHGTRTHCAAAKTAEALLGATVAIAILAPGAALATSEEQRLISISRILKPISNAQWNEIAGDKVNDLYEIIKGDTLWDISKRLFGNSYYWPKVWSLNTGIPNPHVIEPGQRLAFAGGTSEAMPRLSPSDGSSETIDQSGPTSTSGPEESPAGGEGGPREYDKVPANKWAHKDVEPERRNYDQYGIDRELKIQIPSRFAFRVPQIANDTTVPYLGEIVATRRDGVALGQHETVFLRSNSQDLQVGSTYTIFNEPEYIRERKSDRSAYIYRSAGEVKIVGVKDELYVGVITTSYDVVLRGMKVYPLLPLVTDVKPLPARTALEALVLLNAENSTRNSSQFHVIHFDRGIEDGVQIGNIFRVYDYFDPITRAKITDSDFLVNADALVIHATAQFSTAIVLRSHGTFTRGDFAVLLTDVSDLERQLGKKVRGFGEDGDQRDSEDKELDELDDLDRVSGEGLGRKEEAEIKELDQWDKSKDLQNQPDEEPTVPSAAGQPTDEAEQFPGSEDPARQAPPQDPSLDHMLDSPSAFPPGIETPAPPAHLQNAPEQTLEAPPAPPTSDEPSLPGEPSPGLDIEPITPPETSGSIEPALETPPDDLMSQ